MDIQQEERAKQKVAGILATLTNEVKFEDMSHGGVRVAIAKGVDKEQAEQLMAALRPHSEFTIKSRFSWGKKIYRIDIGASDRDKVIEALAQLQVAPGIAPTGMNR